MSKYCEIEAEEVLRKFAEMSGKQMQKARTNAVKASAKILVKQTQTNFKKVSPNGWNKPNSWNGKKLISGIKSSVDREDKEVVKVHIMGDFRLKFWELGTRERFTIYRNKIDKVRFKKQHSTGKFPKEGAKYFFKQAKEQTEKKCFDEMEKLLNISIQKIANKR